MELSIDRLKSGGIHEFELLTKERAISTLPSSLERDSLYRKLSYTGKTTIKDGVKDAITDGERREFSLRDIENLIEEYKNDYQQRIIFTNSIDKMISDMESLGLEGKIHGNKKKYSPKIADLTKNDLMFGETIANLTSLKGEVNNIEDKTKFKAEEVHTEFTKSYKIKFEKVVKKIVEIRLESLKTKFLDLDIKIDEFMLLDEVKDLLEYNKILQDGLNEVIDQVLHRLDNHIIEEIVKKKASSQADTITCKIKGILQKAFNKEKGCFSCGRRFLSPEEIKKVTKLNLQPGYMASLLLEIVVRREEYEALDLIFSDKRKRALR